jgi:DNA topoisomerase-1
MPGGAGAAGPRLRQRRRPGHLPAALRQGLRLPRPRGPARAAAERARIARLGIPPAYERVWICPLPNGHLQATGIDARGRKQYRYHPDWAAWRGEAKYAQLPAFGAALGRLRRRVERDLGREAGDLAFSLAALTLLIDRAHLRVGGASYAAENGSFGATTLLKRHLRLEEGAVRLTYRAKGGKKVRQTLRDKRLHRIFQEIGDLPGRNLFTYLTPEARSAASTRTTSTPTSRRPRAWRASRPRPSAPGAARSRPSTPPARPRAA